MFNKILIAKPNRMPVRVAHAGDLDTEASHV